MPSLTRRLPRLLDVRSGEGRDVAVASGVLLLSMVAHGVLETARDALFLIRLPPERLPWVYLAMAIVGLGAVSAARRMRSGRELTISLLGAALGTALLALPAGSGSHTVAYVVYVWTGLNATLVTVQLWQLLGDRFTVEQAKRLFGAIGAGGVLGVALGSALAAALAARLSPSGLLVVGAAFLALAAAIPLALTPRSAPSVSEAPAELPAPYEVVRAEPHARRLLFLALISTVTLTVVDYVFKSRVAAAVAPAELTAFFGRFYAIVNVAGLFVQIGATAWLLRSLGAARGLSLLPGAVLTGAMVLLAAPALIAMIAVKAIDGALRHSLQRTGFEVLFLPLPDRERRSLKGVVEVVGQRGGQALASAAILVAVAFDAGMRTFAVGLAVLAAIWLAGLVGARAGYVDLFRRRLRAGATDLGALPTVDIAALEVLLVSLGSADETEALSALTVLEQQGKTHLVPPLLAHHPSRQVALRVLAMLARSRRRDLLPLLDGLLISDDPERRAAALRAAHAIAPESNVLGAHVDDESPRVRAMALVPLARMRDDADLDRRVQEIADGHDAASQVALAEVIAHEPHRRWIPVLQALSRSFDSNVRIAVARATQSLGARALIPLLIEMLATRDVRDAARDALASFGSKALPHLARALAHPDTPLAVRRHIPRTLARLPSAKTACVLLERLSLERDGMTRYKILRALGQIHALDPQLPLDRPMLRARARTTLQRIVQLMGWRVALEASRASPTDELRIDFLREKQRYAVERVFRLLGLLGPSDDLALIYDGLRRDDPKARAASRELLADSVEGDVRDALLVIVDDLSDAEKLLRLRGRRGIPDAGTALAQMAVDTSEGVRQLAAPHRHEPPRREVRLASA